MHGMGVSVPNAAVVAAATVGLAIDWHIPNGKIFTRGLLSVMFARGILVIHLLAGRTIRVPGAVPKEHFIAAPPHTANPILSPFFL
jgi:hypothetical protein